MNWGLRRRPFGQLTFQPAPQPGSTTVPRPLPGKTLFPNLAAEDDTYQLERTYNQIMSSPAETAIVPVNSPTAPSYNGEPMRREGSMPLPAPTSPFAPSIGNTSKMNSGGSGGVMDTGGGGGGGGGGSDSDMLGNRCPKPLPWWLIPLAALGILQTGAAIFARK